MVGRGYWYKAIALPSVYSLLSNSVRLAFLLILLLRHPEKLSKSPKDMKLMYGEGKTWASDPKVSNLVTPSTQARWPWGLAALSSSVKCAPRPSNVGTKPSGCPCLPPSEAQKSKSGWLMRQPMRPWAQISLPRTLSPLTALHRRLSCFALIPL